MTHPISYFNDEDKDCIMELARLALADADVYVRFAEKLDLSDEYLQDLQDGLEKYTSGVPIWDEDEDEN